jgi:HAMP domain-containing protein
MCSIAAGHYSPSDEQHCIQRLFFPWVARTDNLNPIQLMYCRVQFFQFYGWLNSSPISCQKKRKTRVNDLVTAFATMRNSWTADLSALKIFTSCFSCLRRTAFSNILTFQSGTSSSIFLKRDVDCGSQWHHYFSNAPPFKNSCNSHPLAPLFPERDY